MDFAASAASEPYDGVVNVVGNPNPVVSGFPKPSPIRWFERVSAATSFYAAFRPPVSADWSLVHRYRFWW